MDSTGTASFGRRAPSADTSVGTLVRHAAPPHRIVLLLPTDTGRSRASMDRHLARVAAMGMALPAGLFDGPAQCRVATPDGHGADSLLTGLKDAADTPARSLIVYVTGQLALAGDQRLYLTTPGLPVRLAHLLGVRWEWITHAITRSAAPTRLLMVDLEADQRAWPLLTGTPQAGNDRLAAEGASLWGQLRPIPTRRGRGQTAEASWAHWVAARLRDGVPGAPAVLTPETLYQSTLPEPRAATAGPAALSLARFLPGSGAVQLRNRALGRGVLSVDVLPPALRDALRRRAEPTAGPGAEPVDDRPAEESA
ncbi:hypothetical protein [Streptacidiphilus albus]|uniref:hypothetical protein n=1 Tax=Streptacidiphilus albus TaxID=105425 RepID=UPI00054B9EC4|nr:hypothetical protein [Streptacidiphilus albus]